MAALPLQSKTHDSKPKLTEVSLSSLRLGPRESQGSQGCAHPWEPMLMFSETRFMPCAENSVLLTCSVQQGPVHGILVFQTLLIKTCKWHSRDVRLPVVHCLVSATLNPIVKIVWWFSTLVFHFLKAVNPHRSCQLCTPSGRFWGTAIAQSVFIPSPVRVPTLSALLCQWHH